MATQYPTVEEIRAQVAAARVPAMRAFLRDADATIHDGETIERAVRRVQNAVCESIRKTA